MYPISMVQLICIIYLEKQNVNILLMHKARTEQLEQKQILDQTTTLTEG